MNENISSLSTQLQVANDINANHPSYKIENQKIPIKKEWKTRKRNRGKQGTKSQKRKWKWYQSSIRRT